MKGYKAFEKGMICRGKQYAENTVFEEDEAILCEKGMHFCKEPLDVLEYYPVVNDKGKMSEFAVICCAGNNSIAKGKVGSWITLSEWAYDEEKAYIPVCVKTVKVDGKKIKEDTFYKLENGKFVEVNANG